MIPNESKVFPNDSALCCNDNWKFITVVSDHFQQSDAFGWLPQLAKLSAYLKSIVSRLALILHHRLHSQLLTSVEFLLKWHYGGLRLQFTLTSKLQNCFGRRVQNFWEIHNLYDKQLDIGIQVHKCSHTQLHTFIIYICVDHQCTMCFSWSKDMQYGHPVHQCCPASWPHAAHELILNDPSKLAKCLQFVQNWIKRQNLPYQLIIWRWNPVPATH